MAKHKNSTIAGLTYLVFFLPFLTGDKNDEFVKYHMKQAIGLLISVLAFQGLIKYVYEIGVYDLLLPMAWALRAFAIVMVVLGFMNAQNGVEKPLPWVGKYSARL